MLLGYLYGGRPAPASEVCDKVIDILATKYRGLFLHTAEDWCSQHEFTPHIVERCIKPWKAVSEEFRREEKNDSLQTSGLDE